MQERRSKLDVQDKKAETSMKFNNVLTTALLLVSGGVLWTVQSMDDSIDQVKDAMGVLATIAAVNQSQLVNIEKRLDSHLKDHHK